VAELLGLTRSSSDRPNLTEPVAPRTPEERLVAAVWAEVLGLEGVGVEADFLALGGDSLLATRVLTRLRHRLGVELPVAPFFVAATVAEQARLVAAYRNNGACPSE
jgi:hypothetical protein